MHSDRRNRLLNERTANLITVRHNLKKIVKEKFRQKGNKEKPYDVSYYLTVQPTSLQIDVDLEDLPASSGSPSHSLLSDSDNSGSGFRTGVELSPSSSDSEASELEL